MVTIILCMGRILFAAKHILTGLWMSRPLFCKQLFAGPVVGCQPTKRRRERHIK